MMLFLLGMLYIISINITRIIHLWLCLCLWLLCASARIRICIGTRCRCGLNNIEYINNILILITSILLSDLWGSARIPYNTLPCTTIDDCL